MLCIFKKIRKKNRILAKTNEKKKYKSSVICKNYEFFL